MYDGTSPAEVRIKASALGLPAGTDINTVDPALLRSVGYRIPNQGKNSMLPLQVIGFLPESHEKAIMVPGGITEQMGSDFDVDKMYLMQAETTMVDKVITRVRPDFSKPLGGQSRPERDTMLYDIMESVMMSPYHLEEVVMPLDSPLLEDLAAEIQTAKLTDSSIDYNHPLAEIEMEARNKTGVAGRGLWANQLAGRNTAQAGNMALDYAYAPRLIYDGEVKTFTELAVDREYVEGKGFTGSYTDYNISMFLSAAVDAANKPIQIDINDNMYTIPVAGMLMSLGMPVTDVVYFLAQPAIVEAIEYAQLNDLNLGQLTRAMDQVASKRKGNINAKRSETFVMDPAELKDVSGEDNAKQLEYLQNFKSFYLAGRALQTINKIITPDNLQNVNEISAINAHIEVEERYLGKIQKPIIHGAKDFVSSTKDGIGNISPMTTAYRGILDSMLEAADDAGFVNNTAAFKEFKSKFKSLVNKHNLSAEHHKFIDRSLFMKLMLSEGSPFTKGVSGEAINHLYTNPTRNIARTLQGIQQKYPLLRNSPLLKALESGVENNTNKDQKVFTIKFDNSFDLSAADKNAMSNSLLQMLTKPERFLTKIGDKDKMQAARKEIRSFAKSIVYNQLLTTGFRPGGYADMIPSEVFTTTILFEDKNSQTPVQFFNNITKSLNHDRAFFDSYMHDFIANFGVASPGGAPLLPVVGAKKVSPPNSDGIVTVKGGKNSNIYDDNFGYAAYFVSFPQTGDPKVFVRHGEGEYRELQRQGAHPVHEVGVNQNQSIFNKGGESTSPGLTTAEQDLLTDRRDDSNSLEQPQKNCKI